jgi:uncharacterized protein YgiM (DUF1202 family)
MNNKGRMLMAVLALGLSSEALAVSKGGTLYVKAKNTRLMASSAASASALTVLQPGQQVTWLGADPKDAQWHQVEVDGKRGVVFQSNLSAKPPSMELVAVAGGVKPHDAAAFANSGAAVKLLADGPLKYGQEKGTDLQSAVNQLKELKDLAATLQPADYAQHAAKEGLFPVVGPSAQVEPAPANTKRSSR